MGTKPSCEKRKEEVKGWTEEETRRLQKRLTHVERVEFENKNRRWVVPRGSRGKHRGNEVKATPLRGFAVCFSIKVDALRRQILNSADKQGFGGLRSTFARPHSFPLHTSSI